MGRSRVDFRLISGLISGLLSLWMVGCGSRELKVGISATYSDINRVVISQKCIQCHASLATHGGLLAIVSPGSARGSELYEVVVEGSMPMQSPPLSDKEISAIEQWINSGAGNN